MKSGLIIYNRIDAKKNDWFINRCLELLNDSGTSLTFLNEDQVFDYLNDHTIDFVIYRGRDYRLLEAIEERGIKAFNNSLTNKTANDKYLASQLFDELDSPHLATYLDKSKCSQYPFVMKSVSGHGGSEVFLIANPEDEEAVLRQYPHQRFVYQDYMPNLGDVRVYVLDQQVVGAVKRNNKCNFRSNYSLGGEVSLYKPSQEMIENALKITKTLSATYVGIDFLLTKDGFLVNEIEDPVGSRMLYQTSDIDIISLFCQMVKRKI